MPKNITTDLLKDVSNLINRNFSIYPETSKLLQEIIDSQDKQELIEKLRNDLLLKLHDLKNNEIQYSEFSSSDCIHKTLLVLANFSPINDNDPITRETISEQKKVSVSTGHQFDIDALITYHNMRTFRDGVDSENTIRILNPITNLPFSKRDQQCIELKALSENQAIKRKLQYSIFNDVEDDEIRIAVSTFLARERFHIRNARYIKNTMNFAMILIVAKSLYDLSMNLMNPLEVSPRNNVFENFFLEVFLKNISQFHFGKFIVCAGLSVFTDHFVKYRTHMMHMWRLAEENTHQNIVDFRENQFRQT